jgi:hypothetical protein
MIAGVNSHDLHLLILQIMKVALPSSITLQIDGRVGGSKSFEQAGRLPRSGYRPPDFRLPRRWRPVFLGRFRNYS